MSLMPSTPGGGPASQQGRAPLFSRDRKLDSILSLNSLDPSEFPSLGQHSAGNSSHTGRPNYVGMVKQPPMESGEFSISHEDFPALPGSKPAVNNNQQQNGSPGEGNDRMTNQGLHQVDNAVHSGIGRQIAQEERISTAAAAADGTGVAKEGIQTSPDGTVRNVPKSVVTDQFGMIGLLTFIRAAETDQNLVSLALGADLTTLGLNLNSEVNLYPTFGGPWANAACRPQDIDCHVPHEYLTNQAIREKLAPVRLNSYSDDVLFYMFYTNNGDVLQLAAAAELYHRDWRFHLGERGWVTRPPGLSPSEQTATYERGTYFFFDVTSWRKVSRDLHLEYSKLEDQPKLPPNLAPCQPAQSTKLANQPRQSSSGQQSPSVFL